MRMRSLIGITTSELRPGELSTLRRHGEPPTPEMALGMPYARAVEAAGALPVVIPPMALAKIPDLVAHLDGIVLSGGPDLAPEAYGAAPHRELGSTEPALDAFEYALAREALARKLPLLGVCRGAQALNVARGGSLHQHLPDVVGGEIAHRQAVDGRQPTHVVEVLPGSRLASIVGATRLSVNSFHHQAIDRLGDGLRACAWAPDGTVEAVEDSSLRFALGVQWHAETLAETPAHLALFSELATVAASRSRLLQAA